MNRLTRTRHNETGSIAPKRRKLHSMVRFCSIPQLFTAIAGLLLTCACGRTSTARREVRSQRAPEAARARSYSTCKATDGGRALFKGSILPALTSPEKAFLDALVRESSSIGGAKALAKLEERTKTTHSMALAFVLIQNLVRSQEHMDALKWIDWMLCRGPLLHRLWIMRIETFLELMKHPMIPGMKMKRFEGGVAVEAGGPSQEQISMIKEHALRTVKHVARVWPADPKILLPAVKLAMKLEKHRLALQITDAAAFILPENEEIASFRLRLLLTTKDPTRARTFLDSAMKRWPTEPWVHRIRVKLARLGKIGSELKAARRALRFYEFQHSSLRVPITAERYRIFEDLDSKDPARWRRSFSKLLGANEPYATALLAGAVKACHFCEFPKQDALRCREAVRALLAKGSSGEKVILAMAREGHPCWMTHKLITDAVAHTWQRMPLELISDLVKKDQSSINFRGFALSLVDARFSYSWPLLRRMIFDADLSDTARLAAIRGFTTLLGARARPDLEKLAAKPLVGGVSVGGIIANPPKPEHVRQAALLCLYSVSGDKTYITRLKKSVRASGGTDRHELLCPLDPGRKGISDFLKDFAGSGHTELVKLAKGLTAEAAKKDTATLLPRSSVTAGGILGRLDEQCKKSSSTASTAAVAAVATVACYQAGRIFMEAAFVPSHGATALVYLEKSCQNRHGDGCNLAGVLYGRGEHTRRSPTKAAELYQKACDLNELGGCDNLGWMKLTGEGMVKDTSGALALFKRACAGSYARGCHHLGVCHMRGTGTRPSNRLAFRYFQRSCSLGFLQDCQNIAMMYMEGLGIPRSKGKAMELLRKTCAAGLDSACERLKLIKAR